MSHSHPLPVREHSPDESQAHSSAQRPADAHEYELIFYCSRPGPDPAAGRAEAPAGKDVETRSQNGNADRGLFDVWRWLGSQTRSA